MKLVKQIPDDVDIESHEKFSRKGCTTVALIVIIFWALLIILTL